MEPQDSPVSATDLTTLVYRLPHLKGNCLEQCRKHLHSVAPPKLPNYRDLALASGLLLQK